MVASIATWLASALVLFVGANAIRQALSSGSDTSNSSDPTRGWQLVFLSFATSVDALAVGISLAMVGTSLSVMTAIVAVVAALLAWLGLQIGGQVSSSWGKRVEVFGGVILIVTGLITPATHLV